MLSINGLNRHPIWGADRNQFSPERWLDRNSLPENLNVFASFSIGRRNCIGESFNQKVNYEFLVNYSDNYYLKLENKRNDLDLIYFLDSLCINNNKTRLFFP